jgi:hypothetical protein
MELIETVTVGSGGQASITFASIAADWTDLTIVASLRQNSRTAGNGGFVYKMTFNGSTSSYSSRILRGSGSSVTSYSDTSIIFFGTASDTTSNTFGSASLYVPNYASSNSKSVSLDSVQENNATTAYSGIAAGLWSNASAVTSIKLEGLFGDTLAQHSTASLYGIASGSDGTTTVS